MCVCVCVCVLSKRCYNKYDVADVQHNFVHRVQQERVLKPTNELVFILEVKKFLEWVFGSKPKIRPVVSTSLRDFHGLFYDIKYIVKYTLEHSMTASLGVMLIM